LCMWDGGYLHHCERSDVSKEKAPRISSAVANEHARLPVCRSENPCQTYCKILGLAEPVTWIGFSLGAVVLRSCWCHSSPM
jgi:hypothetical protein